MTNGARKFRSKSLFLSQAKVGDELLHLAMGSKKQRREEKALALEMGFSRSHLIAVWTMKRPAPHLVTHKKQGLP